MSLGRGRAEGGGLLLFPRPSAADEMTSSLARSRWIEFGGGGGAPPLGLSDPPYIDGRLDGVAARGAPSSVSGIGGWLAAACACRGGEEWRPATADGGGASTRAEDDADGGGAFWPKRAAGGGGAEVRIERLLGAFGGGDTGRGALGAAPMGTLIVLNYFSL